MAKERIDLEWYFGHTTKWNNESDLSIEKKDKIRELTDFLERINIS